MRCLNWHIIVPSSRLWYWRCSAFEYCYQRVILVCYGFYPIPFHQNVWDDMDFVLTKQKIYIHHLMSIVHFILWINIEPVIIERFFVKSYVTAIYMAVVHVKKFPVFKKFKRSLSFSAMEQYTEPVQSSLHLRNQIFLRYRPISCLCIYI